MLPSSADDQNEPDIEADRQADSMKDQLRKDVASWAASRSAEASGLDTRSVAPAARQTIAAPTERVVRRKAKPVEPISLTVAEKKPFKMSYDGTTERDYIAHRIKHGAR